MYELLVIPSFLAISAVSLTPTSRMSWANTVFTDLVVATLRFMEPPPSPSAALQILPPCTGRQSGAGYVFSGVTPLEKAVARVNGLKAEPAWRPPPPPSTTLPSQQVAETTILSRGSDGFLGQPPRAKLSLAYFPVPNWRPPTMAFTYPDRGPTETSDSCSSG